jgi:hypothetical protein
MRHTKPIRTVREVVVDVSADIDIPPCPVTLAFDILEGPRDKMEAYCVNASGPKIVESVKTWAKELERAAFVAIGRRVGQLEEDSEQIMELSE